ncbi:cytochrome P450 [Rhodobacteraceae bacterium CCMM004]|nr:cytochrome P450 [Rhodobacteraceae bacterium CCMM004]
MQRIAQSPTDPAFVQDPYPFYHRARALGDIVWWEDYDLPVATSHAAVSALLRDRRLGRAAPPGRGPRPTPHTAAFYAIEAHSMLELEPPRHTRLRGLVLRAFTSARIAGLEDGIRALCHDLIDRLPAGGGDLLPLYCRPLPVIVIARLLGVPEDMADRLLSWSNAMVGMYQAGRSHADEVAAGAAAAAFADFLGRHIDARRRRPGAALIDDLIAARDSGDRLSPEELVATCILLLNAGHEATVHTMGNGIAALLTHGGATAATVEEILRHDPPLHLFDRWVYEEATLFGHRFAPGDRVGLLLAAAGRDPARFPDPDRFDPARPPGPHQAFGAGLHFCVGAPLARLELQIALPLLFERRPGLAVAAPPRYADIYHFHGLGALHCTW